MRIRTFGAASLGADTFENLAPERLEQARDNLIKAEFLGSGFPPLVDDHLRGVQVPTLLLSGQKSLGLYARLLDRLQELLPHVE